MSGESGWRDGAAACRVDGGKTEEKISGVSSFAHCCLLMRFLSKKRHMALVSILRPYSPHPVPK